VTPLTELNAVFTDHCQYGELDAGVEGDRVWMTCSCGAVLVRVEAFG
jgi:hypothetical protein